MSCVEIELGETSNTCFILMPFSPTFTAEYERVIRPAVEEAGLECIRGDEIYKKPRIMSDIWDCLRSSKLVIAELTGKNPNVFYELGLAHAIGKPSIIITRNSADVPFDLQALRYLNYNIEDPYWGNNLKNGLITKIKQVMSEDYETIFSDIVLKGEEKIHDKTVQIQDVEIIDISGDWKGLMTMPDPFVVYNIEASLIQDKTQINGVMIISYEYEDLTSIVEETVTGQIADRAVSLYGTTVSVKEQGASSGYNEDNFTMTLSQDNKLMEGKATSGDNEGTVKLEKIDEK